MLGFFQLVFCSAQRCERGERLQLARACLFVMNNTGKKILPDPRKNRKNSLAPDPGNMLAFRKYTRRVWSKVAGRPISEAEADQIIENFGRFILALSKENGEQS